MNAVLRSISKIFILITVIVFSFTDYAFAQQDLITYTYGYYYTTNDLYQLSEKLVERYSDILQMNVIGKSADGKPIYVVRMTDNIKNYKEEDYVDKMHLLVDAGLHSRETYNSFVVLKTIEDYAKDYYNNSTLTDIDVINLLENNVIHFIVTCNPDGYDLTKFGLDTIQNKSVKDYLINNISDKNYSSFKANLKGVDLNRNFEDIYYNTISNKWINQWNVNYVPLVSNRPSSQFYAGSSASSEIETQALSKYYLKYDFRAYLSYHSQGRVIYYYQGHQSKEYNNLGRDYSKIVKNITDYIIMPDDGIIGYGYASYFAANNTLKPFITVETAVVTLPTPISLYKTEYENRQLYKLPAEFLSKMQSIGYYDYKIYVNNTYVRDIMDKEYAYALAEKLGGIVVESKGRPIYKLVKNYDFNSVKIEQSFMQNKTRDTSLTVNVDNPYTVEITIKDLNNTDISLTIDKVYFLVPLKLLVK